MLSRRYHGRLQDCYQRSRPDQRLVRATEASRHVSVDSAVDDRLCQLKCNGNVGFKETCRSLLSFPSDTLVFAPCVSIQWRIQLLHKDAWQTVLDNLFTPVKMVGRVMRRTMKYNQLPIIQGNYPRCPPPTRIIQNT